MYTQGDGVDKLSVIIRCKNEEMWIGHAIQSVIDVIPGSEIIVIDNKSKDDSMEIVKGFGNVHNIKVVNMEDYYPGKALNLGARMASCDKMLVLSSHCVLTDFQYKILEDMNEEGFVALFGSQSPIYRGRKINTRYIWSHFTYNSCVNMYSEIENRQFLHNALCVYDRKFLLENPFDETLTGKEDRYWAIDIVEKGHRYLYDPRLRCNHHWTPNGATWKGIG